MLTPILAPVFSPAFAEAPMACDAAMESARAGLVRFEAGQTIFSQGDRPDAVHVVDSGLVALSLRHEDGRRHIIFLAGPGDILCAPLTTRAPADAEVLAPSRLRVISPSVMERDLPLGMRINDQLQRQYERTLQHVFVLGQREARQRVRWFLASLASGNRQIELPLSRQDIADYLGMTIETVSREFMRLKRMGVIGYQRHGAISVLKPKALFAGVF